MDDSHFYCDCCKRLKESEEINEVDLQLMSEDIKWYCDKCYQKCLDETEYVYRNYFSNSNNIAIDNRYDVD